MIVTEGDSIVEKLESSSEAASVSVDVNGIERDGSMLPTNQGPDARHYMPSLDKEQGQLGMKFGESGQRVDNEPMITKGSDVSRFAVSLHDTNLPSLTPRSFIIGTVIAGLGASLAQIYLFKPTDVPVSSVFLLLLVLGIGKLWEVVFYVPTTWLEESNMEQSVWGGGSSIKRSFARTMLWLNPGPFGMKEHVVATLVATTAAAGSTAVNNFAVQRLFYNTNVSATTAVLATFSTATFGYGLVGLLRPLTVFPSEMVYWTNLPNVLTFQALHFDKTRTSKRLKLFWSVLSLTAVYEVFPQYIFPVLNGISIPCLATQHSSPSVQGVMTNIFGGANGNEGLGLIEFGFDWQYITSSYLVYPLIQQVNSWIGFVLCYIAVSAIYYSNVFDAKNYPFLSTAIFSSTSTAGNPVLYNQTAVFGSTFTLNNTALEQEGIPQFAASYVWTLMASNWAVGGMFAHVILFWGGYIKDSVKRYAKYRLNHLDAQARHKEASVSGAGLDEKTKEKGNDHDHGHQISFAPPPLPRTHSSTAEAEFDDDYLHSLPAAVASEEKGALDPHYLAMQKYPEAPWWWYLILLTLSFFAGLIVVIKGGTTLPVWGYIVALAIGAIVTPFSNIIVARLGNGIATDLLVRMVAGALHPGKPVANLYFSMWSHDVVNTAIHLAGDLKMGQYLKIPPRVMFLTQVWGTILGCIVNYAVMVSIVTSKRDILLRPEGTNIWSGQTVQAFNSQAVTWSLASQVFGLHSKYIWVPVGLLLGTIPTVIQYFVWKKWKKIGPVPVDIIVLPVIYQYSQWLTTGVNSVILTTIAAGIVSQVWLRRYHPSWFRKYIYILGGAVDGGTQIIVFILAFAVFGASGTARPFPNWWGNPSEARNIDYCAFTS